MSTKAIAISLFLVGAFGGSTVPAQTRSEFKKIFRVDSSRIYRNLKLKPTFNRDRQICRLRLEPQEIVDNIDKFGYTRVSGRLATEVLDLISPEKDRGAQTDDWGIGTFLGQVYIIPYEFDHMRVVVSGHIFPRSGGKMSQTRFIFEREGSALFPSAELVTFTWKNRPCG